MSYTTFSYSNISVEGATAVTRRSTLESSTTLYGTAHTVSFTITNTGSLDGNEVAQLYLSFPESAGEPPKNLRGESKAIIVFLEIVLAKLTRARRLRAHAHRRRRLRGPLAYAHQQGHLDLVSTIPF